MTPSLRSNARIVLASGWLLLAMGQAAGAAEPGKAEPEKAEAGVVTLTPKQLQLAGIATVPVRAETMGDVLRFPAEVRLDANRVAEIVPRVPGVVRAVKADLGENVRAGAPMVVLDSRELAETKAAFLAARERLALAEDVLRREEYLWKQKISAEQDYLTARQAAAEARINAAAAAQQLRTLGLSPADIPRLDVSAKSSLAEFAIKAPFSGTVIERHVVQGEQVEANTTMFRIADLSTVWVIAQIPEKNLADIALGQRASVTVRAYAGRTFAGAVSWIGAVLDEKTRTLPVRIEVPNAERLLKPGTFAEAAIAAGAARTAVVVPPTAVQAQGKEAVVFVADGNGRFEQRRIEIAGRTADAVEVAAGLKPGEQVVTSGSFALLSEVAKSAFEAD